jgi:hypothetical protein
VFDKESRMKRLFTLLFLGLFGAGLMVGCEASGSVGDEDDDATYRKTTTVKDGDGDYKRTETKTEIKRDD